MKLKTKKRQSSSPVQCLYLPILKYSQLDYNCLLWVSLQLLVMLVNGQLEKANTVWSDVDTDSDMYTSILKWIFAFIYVSANIHPCGSFQTKASIFSYGHRFQRRLSLRASKIYDTALLHFKCTFLLLEVVTTSCTSDI